VKSWSLPFLLQLYLSHIYVYNNVNSHPQLSIRWSSNEVFCRRYISTSDTFWNIFNHENVCAVVLIIWKHLQIDILLWYTQEQWRFFTSWMRYDSYCILFPEQKHQSWLRILRKILYQSNNATSKIVKANIFFSRLLFRCWYSIENKK